MNPEVKRYIDQQILKLRKELLNAIKQNAAETARQNSASSAGKNTNP